MRKEAFLQNKRNVRYHLVSEDLLEKKHSPFHFIQKKILRPFFLISTGGMVYYNFEIFYRGFSHVSMFICGGLSFYCIGLLNETKKVKLSFPMQMFLGSLIITGFELITGYIVNIRMGLQVWDYSALPMNYRGQICLIFSVIWFFLSPICIISDDYLRYLLFGREKPKYHL